MTGSENEGRTHKVKTGIWFIWTLGLSAFFISMVTTNLDNYRVVTADDVWIMSVSHKLATEGILGADLYAGFFNAEQHYFINLPFFHLLQALSFKIAGVGIAQARYVNVLSAGVLIWLLSWFTYRWYGLMVAIITGLLLVFWRSYLIGGGYYGYGISLLEVARSGRYDLLAVTLVWLSIVLLDRLLRRPNWLVALAVGICCGLAALTQFFGLFVLPLVIVVWWWHCIKDSPSRSSLPPTRTQPSRGIDQLSAILKSTFHKSKHSETYTIMLWMIAGFMLIVLPYGSYIIYHSADAVNQALLLKQNRAQFHQFNFYLDNIRHEPHRYYYAGLSPQSILILPLSFLPLSFSRPGGLGPGILLVGIWPSLIYLGYRIKATNTSGDQILLSSLFMFQALLALLDATKAPIYGLLLLPSISMLLAVSWVALGRWWTSQKIQNVLLHRASGGLIIGVLLIVIIEGAGVYWLDQQQAVREVSYLDIGQKIAARLEPGAHILGSERWWWALHHHPYLAVNNLFGRWVAQANNGEALPEFADIARQTQIDFVIVNDNVRGMSLYPNELQSQFWKFLEDCNVLVAEVTSKNYGLIEIYRVMPTCKI